jgi:hypothetical protein
MRTLSSPLKEIMVTVCFTSIPPLRARFLRSIEGGATSRNAASSTSAMQGGGLAAKSAELRKSNAGGGKSGLR